MPTGINIDRQHTASVDALPGNIPYRGIEWHSPAIPDYLIYIFNISARTFEDAAGRGIIGRILLRAPGVTPEDSCAVTVEKMVKGQKTLEVAPGEVNQPYHLITTFPQPILVTKFNDESGEIEPKETDGRRFVVDMISPDNLTYSLDVAIDPSKAFSIGNDYAPKGIFFSYHNPPLQQDVQKAYLRMEKYYAMLNEKAQTLDITDKLGLQNAIASNPDHVYAANYYGKPFAWARKAVRPVDCPNCGEQKPAGRLFHQTSFGTFCVEPTQDAWRAVVMSGNRKYEDVPDELRWKREIKVTQ
jgi:hypothetical protein